MDRAETCNLPDIPRWVEAHGIAADPTHWRRELGDGCYALGHDAMRLVVLVGEPPAVLDLPSTHAVLSTTPLPRSARAILHTLDGDAPDFEGAVELPASAPLPEYLATELTWARTRGPIWTCYVDGEPAAFAYAPWRSPTLFDVSVDVIPGARQLGLGTIVASALIAAERPRRPVWGADEGNHASLRLAARLGFTPLDEIWVAPPS